jgi:hypothetical protein
MTKAEEMQIIADDVSKEDTDKQYQKHLKEIEKLAKQGRYSYTYKHPIGFLTAMKNKFAADGFTYSWDCVDDSVTITINWM